MLSNQGILDRVEEALVGVVPTDIREKILDSIAVLLQDEFGPDYGDDGADY